MLTIAELEHWLQEDDGPSRVVYHVGQLSRDRLAFEVHDGKMITVTMEPLHSIADLLADLAEKGKVLLFQRRVQPFVWEYIAQRRGK